MNKPVIGASDVSLKDKQCAHAWICSTEDPTHIGHPLFSITGKGPIDGYERELFMTRGEL
jgi:hypothetical protein